MAGRNFSSKTLARRRSTLGKLERCTGPGRLLEATADQVFMVMVSVPAAWSRYAYLADMRAFYRWAVRHGLTDSDPTLLIDAPRLPRAVPKPLERADIAGLLVAPLWLARAIALGCYAGLRRAEIAGLDWVEVDTARGTVTVRGGKGGKDRVVPMHPVLAGLLEPGGRSGPVVSRTGTSMSPEALGYWIRKHLRGHGLTATCHQLRHTFGTEAAISSGGDVIVVAELMGHASTQTTLGYCRASSERARAVIAGLFDQNAA